MSRGLKILLGLMFIFLLFLIFSDDQGVKKVNWKQSYLRKHKIPYGTYITFNELSSFFPKARIKTINISPYSFLKSSDKNGTYILINKSINIGKEELEQMKDFVERGNNIFISSHDFNLDSLGFHTANMLLAGFNASKYLKLTNKGFGEKEYSFNRPFMPMIFHKIDTANSTVLGIIEVENKLDTTKEAINFVKLKYGDGYFYLHTFPEAFTNNFILDSINSEYTAGLLTYLGSPKTIFWDAHYKVGRERISSPLHFVFNNKSLKWAYYFLIFGTLIFIIFRGKRKQKIIPIVKPEKNTSLEFARTIANMYLATSNHKKIADLMINFFNENIRTKYLLDTQNIDDKFITDLAAKTNKTEEEITKTFKIFDRLKAKTTVTKEELVDLEKIIESYKNN